jgi:hypothetical protein
LKNSLPKKDSDTKTIQIILTIVLILMPIAVKNMKNNTEKYGVFYYSSNSDELDGIEIKKCKVI